MKTFKYLLALLVLALPVYGHAQTAPSTLGPMYNPNWAQGYVPTPFQWGLMWSNKMDYFPNGLPFQYGGCAATSAAQCAANLNVISKTLPSGQIFIGNGSNVATPQTMNGDCTLSILGAIICTKTNNVSFGYFATGTDAANLTGTAPIGVIPNLSSLYCSLTGCNMTGQINGTGLFMNNFISSNFIGSNDTGKYAWNSAGDYSGTNDTILSRKSAGIVSSDTPSTQGAGSFSGASMLFNGGTSGTTTLVPEATASGTLTLPAATDTLVGRATTDTLTNKTINGPDNTITNIANSSLVNSSTTVNGTVCTLGSPCTVTAAATLQVGTTGIVGGTVGNVFSHGASNILQEITLAPVATSGSASDLSTGTLAAVRGGAGTVSGILKANGSGTVSAATAGTDYAAAPTGTANQLLANNGSGGFTNITTANNAIVATNGSGVPSVGTAIPNGVTATTQANTDSSTKVATTAFVASLLRGYINGLTMSTTAGGGSASFTVTAGAATDSTHAAVMQLASSLTKTTSAWSAGASGGCLDTGTIATFSRYGIFLIENPSSSAVDIVCTLEVAGTPPSPTMPSGYTLKRYIGSIFTDGSSKWQPFVQQGDWFYKVQTTEASYSATQPATLTTLVGLPLGVIVQPLLSDNVGATGSGSQITTIYVSSPADGNVQLPIGGINIFVSNATSIQTTPMVAPPTNRNGQVYISIPNFSPTAGGTIYSHGWVDRRGKDD